jgi:hypothetical protein
VVPSWPALCWIAQGSGFKSQRGHLFFGISPRWGISQEGFAQGLVSLYDYEIGGFESLYIFFNKIIALIIYIQLGQVQHLYPSLQLTIFPIRYPCPH